MEEHRPVGGRDAVAERPAVGGVGDAASAAVGLDQLGQHPGDPGEGRRQRRGMVGAVGVDQHLGVALGQPVAAPGRREGRVVAGQIAGHRLLLEPLAGIPGVDAGLAGDLGLGRLPEVGQGPVEAELDAEIHAKDLHAPRSAPRPAARPAPHARPHRWRSSWSIRLPPRALHRPSRPAAWPRSPTARVQLAYRDAMMPR